MSAHNIIWLTRVSTDDQDVRRQYADMEKTRAKFNLNVVRTLELVGVSGTSTPTQPQIQEMLKELADPNIHGIGLSALDRLWRPREYGSFAILDPFVKQGQKIWSTRDGEIDPGSDEGFDKCISGGGRSGAEWRELKRRTTGGRIETLQDGALDCGCPPYGYVYVPKWRNREETGKQRGGRFDLDPAEALPGVTKQNVIRWIFEWRRSGMSRYSIAKELSAKGILSARGSLWGQIPIKQLTRNRTYIGQHVRCGIVVPCPAIIDETLFNEVQALTDDIRRKHVGRPPRITDYLLRGFLFCAKCGHRCMTNPGKQHNGARIPNYRCGNIDYRPYKRRCDAPQVRLELIEKVAWGAIWDLLKDPALLLSMARAHFESLEKPEDGGNDQRQREIARLHAGIKTTQRMMKDQAIDYAAGLADIQADKKRIRDLEDLIRSTDKAQSLPPLHLAQAACQQIKEGPEPSTFGRRRSILDCIQDLTMKYADGDLEIEGKIPIGDPVESGTCKDSNCNSGIGADT
jgi:DNA invertase Pin-like site-specific DNA recombinase